MQRLIIIIFLEQIFLFLILFQAQYLNGSSCYSQRFPVVFGGVTDYTKIQAMEIDESQSMIFYGGISLDETFGDTAGGIIPFIGAIDLDGNSLWSYQIDGDELCSGNLEGLKLSPDKQKLVVYFNEYSTCGAYVYLTYATSSATIEFGNEISGILHDFPLTVFLDNIQVDSSYNLYVPLIYSTNPKKYLLCKINYNTTTYITQKGTFTLMSQLYTLIFGSSEATLFAGGKVSFHSSQDVTALLIKVNTADLSIVWALKTQLLDRVSYVRLLLYDNSNDDLYISVDREYSTDGSKYHYFMQITDVANVPGTITLKQVAGFQTTRAQYKQSQMQLYATEQILILSTFTDNIANTNNQLSFLLIDFSPGTPTINEYKLYDINYDSLGCHMKLLSSGQIIYGGYLKAIDDAIVTKTFPNYVAFIQKQNSLTNQSPSCLSSTLTSASITVSAGTAFIFQTDDGGGTDLTTYVDSSGTITIVDTHTYQLKQLKSMYIQDYYECNTLGSATPAEVIYTGTPYDITGKVTVASAAAYPNMLSLEHHAMPKKGLKYFKVYGCLYKICQRQLQHFGSQSQKRAAGRQMVVLWICRTPKDRSSQTQTKVTALCGIGIMSSLISQTQSQ